MGSKVTLRQWVTIGLAVAGLALVYVFQRVDYVGVLAGALGWGSPSPNWTFAVNKTLRMVANDLLCLVVVRAWFADPQVTRLAWWVFAFELLVLLPAYLVVKLWLEGPTEFSVPWLQQVHRLVVNPMLMALLFIALLYQKKIK